MNEEYTPEQWEEEMKIGKYCGLHFPPLGVCNLLCPSCKEVGFYGPREQRGSTGEITRKYRACKWCGFWQEAWGFVKNASDGVGGEQYRCVMVRHKCGVGEIWIVPWNNRQCDKCGQNVEEIARPIDDPRFKEAKEKIDKMHQDLNLPRISM